MTTIDEDIKMAHTLIENEEKFVEYYWRFFHLWPFTTVNMKEYLSHFDLRDKKCVTIQGSSDHIFELFLQHPKQIIGIDTNPLTGHYGALKIAAFKALSTPEEFLHFFRWYDYPYFCQTNKNAFDKDVFEEISKYLKDDSHIFWGYLFNSYNPIKIRSHMFAANDEHNTECLNASLNYLSPENYQYIHENIDKLNYEFMCTDIRELSRVLQDKQDFITLSNLIIYAHNLYPDNALDGWNNLIQDLSAILNDDGKIMAGYLYDIENENDHRDIYKKELRDAVFKEDHYSYQYVTRMHDLHCQMESNNHDAILIYEETPKKR